MKEDSERPMWQLLLKKPEDLTCQECSAVIDYYLDSLGDDLNALQPIIERYLATCPKCNLRKQIALYRFVARHEQADGREWRAPAAR